MPRTIKKDNRKQSSPPPARTVEARERQLIGLAYELAEKKLKDGSASSQVITHFLELGSSLAELEKEKLEHENLLLKTRSEALKSSVQSEELYAAALLAMRIYSGSEQKDEMD